MFKKVIPIIIKVLRLVFKQSRSVIVPPSGFGSVGDDAMVRVLIRHGQNQKLLPIILGGHDANSWAHIGTVKLADSQKIIITALNIITLLVTARNLYIIGADIMDGHYDPNSIHKRLKLARLFSNAGIDVRITGFSFNDHPDDRVCQDFNTLNNVHLFLRDDKSLERFIAKTECDATLSADLAFLTEFSDSDSNVKQILQWVDEKKADKNTVIIVNINWIPFRMSNITVEQLIGRYYEICRELSDKLERKVSFLLVPNDFRDPEKLGDCKLVTLLHNKLLAELDNDSLLVDVIFSAEELKLFSQKCDFVLTGRMHLAIITSTNAIPSFSVSYQSKFSGFYKHIGLEPSSLMIEPNQLFNSDIVSKILINIKNKSKLHKIISDRLSKVEELAQKNL